MTILHGLTYLSVLVFVVACVARGVRIARMPMHLRWELQPVPHAKPGESMFEKVNWWEHSGDKDHFGELAIMIPEILLLKGVWEHNRPLWFPTFALHFGLYMLIGNLVLAGVFGILLLSGVAQDGTVGLILTNLIRAIALIGGGLGTLGAILMLIKRSTDKSLRMFATPSHYVNLVHIGALCATSALWAGMEPGFVTQLAGFYAGLFTGSGMAALPVIATVNVAVVLLFFLYLPFTHMTHFFTKYFTYHTVRWEEEPNLAGNEKMAARIVKNASQPVSWAAPHINADGKKSWIDLAGETGEVSAEKKEA